MGISHIEAELKHIEQEILAIDAPSAPPHDN